MKPAPQKILIFEWLCGGGQWTDSLPAEESGLFDQGRQMLTAVCDQFAQSGYHVVVPLDARHPLDLPATCVPVKGESALLPTLLQQAEHVDEILVIAPETAGCLVSILQYLDQYQPKLLNPDLDFTTLAADKNRMQSWLLNRGVPVPHGCSANQWKSLQLKNADQFVLKPADSCGGSNLFIVDANFDQQDILGKVTGTRPDHNETIHSLQQWRIEEFVSGVAASVSVIRNAKSGERNILPPLRQVFDNHQFGKFSHCEDDLPDAFANRARQLAEKTVDALPSFAGFIGIDMVLGNRDVVIEINPRITMSYCALANVVGLPSGNSISSQDWRPTDAR